MKSAALTILKIGIAVVLIWYVFAYLIEYDDKVVVVPAGQKEPSAEYVGRLEGDWHADHWVFTAEGGERVFRPPLPPDHQLRPGFFTLLAGMRIPPFLLGLVLWGVLLAFVTLRWMILLRAVGVPTSYRNALRLCFVGYFFNIIMPGLTSGDLVRAALVTRGLEGNRARAFMSVLVDRVIGLFSLLVLAGLVLFFGGVHIEGAPPWLGVVRRYVLLILALAIVLPALYLSRRARRLLGIEWLLRKLPFQQKVAVLDDALTVYRERPGAVGAALGLSVVLQACGVLSFWLMAQALGADLTLPQVYVAFPVVQTVSSLPLAPSGFGVGETMFALFFRGFGSTATLGVATSIVFRLVTQVGVGLLGGVVWMLSREHKEHVDWKREART
ncbi:MAG: flippase-like domain-containing protein [Planctomycetota bacterium]|nr:MAG: flippase-like domain-containing protein [Planctomycetota bacterium]